MKNKTLTFKEMLKKYFQRNGEILESDDIVHEMNGVVLYETNKAIFDFHGLLVKEIIEYCKENGYHIDKVVFVSSYDIEVEDGLDVHMDMVGDSKISIIEKDDKLIARYFTGEFVDIKRI